MPLTAARKLGWFDQKIMVRVCRVRLSENQPSSIGNSLSPKNRIPSNNFGRHLPQQEVSTRTSYQEQRSIKCNTSSEKTFAKVLRLSEKTQCVMIHAGMSQGATPATWNDVTRRLKPPKVRVTAIALLTQLANGGRLQTVANGCEHKSSVERTQIHPKTQLHADAEPRNAEPTMHTFWLRQRVKIIYKDKLSLYIHIWYSDRKRRVTRH